MHCKREQGCSFGRNNPVCSKRVTQKLDDFSLYIRGFIVYGMTILIVDITWEAKLFNDFARALHPYVSAALFFNGAMKFHFGIKVQAKHRHKQQNYRNLAQVTNWGE